MEESQKNRLRTYAWNYFVYHADQRMKTFNFYLVLEGVFVAGVLTFLAKSAGAFNRLPSYLCFVIGFLSLMFWLLDRRNAQLVKNGEKALTYLDSLEDHPDGSEPHVLALFAADEYGTKIRSRRLHISYTVILRTIFVFFGVVPVIFGIVLW